MRNLSSNVKHYTMFLHLRTDKREKPQYIKCTGFNVVILLSSKDSIHIQNPNSYVQVMIFLLVTTKDTTPNNNESKGPRERQHHSPDTLSECYSVECASHTLELLHAGVIKLAPPFTDVSLN